MKVILMEDIKSLGKKGDVCEVSDGYARNYIIPRKKGVEATPDNLNNLKLKQANDAKVAQENLEAAQKLAADLSKKPVIIKVKVGDGGKLFGAIATKEIAAAVKEQTGLDLDKKKIVLNDPIKTLGEHNMKLKLHKDVTAALQVNVVEE